MRYELQKKDGSWIIKDLLFARCQAVADYEQARQLATELNKRHHEELTYFERQFL
ncbi:MAG: hypothetical protein N2491_07235 [Negativicutes bacterium]|nr:hypothetical protein [Negativicutes bacterium]